MFTEIFRAKRQKIDSGEEFCGKTPVPVFAWTVSIFKNGVVYQRYLAESI